MSFSAMLERVRVRLALLLARGVVQKTGAAAPGGWPTLQAELLPGEIAKLQHWQPYGFSSRVPPGGGELLAGFIGGDRSHGFAICVGDRRFQVDLAEGEAAISDDLGQVVHLTRAGIVIDAGALPVTVKSTTSIEIEAPLAHFTGDVLVDGNVTAVGEVSDSGPATALDMAAMRAVFNTHQHTGGGNPPLTPM